MADSIYDIRVKDISGKEVSLEAWRGKVLLIVNVASQCGFTPQYEGLEALHKKYAAQGLAVLGFPCNQFGGQEPGAEKEIASFCQLNFGVTFPLFSKIEVNGPGTHPLYVYLKKQKSGFLGTGNIKWNFTKFLVDKNGKVLARYGSMSKPEALVSEIEKALR